MYIYEKAHQKIVRSALPKNEITEGTRKFENELTKLTMAIQIEAKFPTDHSTVQYFTKDRDRKAHECVRSCTLLID